MNAIHKETEQLVFLGQAGWPEEVINEHVKKMCSSTAFDDGDQARILLSYLVSEALAGHLIDAEDIARELGKRDFGKGDPFVRAAMQRLRRRMQNYYAAIRRHPLQLAIPSETYLVMTWRFVATRTELPQSSSLDIPVIASIVEPGERAEVYRRVLVRGRIDALDPDARPWLIVLAPDNFYYPQCRVSRRSPFWEAPVTIGRVQWGETDGMEFDIVLAAAGVDGDFAMESYMKNHGDGYGTRLPDSQIIASRRIIRRDIRPESPTPDLQPPYGAA
jgi:hypothetical protein